VQTHSGRGVMLLIHGLWLRPGIWAAWLDELDTAGYDAVILSWSEGDRSPDRGPAAAGGFDELVAAARQHARNQRTRPIVVGHGVGGAVAERLLAEGDAAAAISLAPVPGGRLAIPAAAGLLRGNRRLARLSLSGGPVLPSYAQFRRTMASVGDNPAARRFYAEYVVARPPRDILLPVLRRRVPARGRAPRRGPLLLAAGGKDQLIRETSVAARHRRYRRYQPDAITDYQVFPYLDHTLALGTPGRSVLFYCLDWLTAHEL
jgi:alpha-beta hydrolase superfamily lysophospholipase